MICNSPQDWHGLYRKDYDLATPESNQHPAKASWDLAFKILDHLKELGLLKEGDTVIDPMAGTGRFLLAACAKGFKAIACELEPKFIAMLEANKAYASKKLCLPGFELPLTIIQGDARNLSQLLKERGLIALTSPPYSDADGHPSLGSVNKDNWGQEGKDIVARRSLTGNYGSTPGQIGNLSDKPIVGITSPPYGIEAPNLNASELDGPIGNRSRERERRPPGDPLVAISSPPYEDVMGRSSHGGPGYHGPDIRITSQPRYGQVEGQIGQERDQNYLGAMKIVYSEVAKVADVLVVVTKDPTRNKRLRELCKDTQALLEATGWRILCHHHAILFTEQEMGHLFEGQVKKPRGRLSFFKLLSYRKGSPVASHEDILICVKC